jgi:hypothetical protein
MIDSSWIRVDDESLPIALQLTEGQAHDGVSARDMLGSAQQVRSCWPTGPMTAARYACMGPNAVSASEASAARFASAGLLGWRVNPARR